MSGEPRKTSQGLKASRGNTVPTAWMRRSGTQFPDASMVSDDMETVQTHSDESRSLETVIFLFISPAAFTSAWMRDSCECFCGPLAGGLLAPDPLCPGPLLAPLQTAPSAGRFRFQPTRRAGRCCAGPPALFSSPNSSSAFVSLTCFCINTNVNVLAFLRLVSASWR